MTRRLVLVSLAAGALTVPAPASSAATTLPGAASPAGVASTSTSASGHGLAAAARAARVPTIREINLRPASPVVGAGDSVRMVIDVVAKDVKGRNGVSVKVEPGAPPQSAPGSPGSSDGTSPATGAVAPGEPAAQAPRPAAPAPRPAAPGTGRPGSAASGPGTQDRTPPAGSPAGPPAVAPAVAFDDLGAPMPSGHAIRPAGRPLLPTRDHQPGVVVSHDHSSSASPGTAREIHGAARLAPRSPERDHKRGSAAGRDAGRDKGDATVSWRPTPGWMRFDGDWQTWRFLPDKALNRTYPAGTWTITATAVGADGATATKYTTFQLRRETRLDAVRVAPAPDGSAVRFTGSLTRVGPRGLADYAPFAAQPVDVLWRPEGSDTWEEVAEATTGETGAFTTSVAGRTGGSWRLRYEGTSRYAPILSKIHQIAE
ncbi:hypothetical protein ACIBG4_35660 [Nonomuraea sp. NPDC050383]|uniref:hypothetical protein n=1 Tax=Nonomuraea sp. NPDC050383 TaxID=3364362 RepID=UPI0037894DB0